MNYLANGRQYYALVEKVSVQFQPCITNKQGVRSSNDRPTSVYFSELNPTVASLNLCCVLAKNKT